MSEGNGADGEEKESIQKRFGFLVVSRAARSIGIVYVTLSLPLYLHFLGISVSIIGALLLLMVLFSVGISLFAGALGDRIGYRYSLLIGEVPVIVATFLLFHYNTIVPIEIATVIGGIGGTPGGLRGVFAPGLNALVARNWPDSESRVKHMGMVMGVCAFSAFAGALLLYSHRFIDSIVGEAAAFRLLYLISFILALVSFACIAMVRERRVPRKRKGIIDKKSGRYTLRVIASNLVYGSGIGFSISLLPVWIELRFSVTPSTVGLIFTFSYLATAVSSLLAMLEIDRLHSPMWTASLTRIIQGAIIMAFAVPPTLLAATALYVMRSAFAGFGAPIRTAINVKGISESNFGIASSAQGMAIRSSTGTSAISGYLMESTLALPMEIGGVLQLIGGAVYYKLLKSENR